MKPSRCRSFAALITLVCMACLSRFSVADLPIDGSVPTSQPANRGQVKSAQELEAEFVQANRQIATLLPPEVLANPNKRAEFGPRAVPLIYHRLDLLNSLATTGQIAPLTIVKLRSLSQALLYAVDELPTVSKVDDMVKSNDPSRKLTGQLIQINGHWLCAGNSDQQSSVVDELEKIDRANPVDIRLTQLTVTMVDAAKSPELENRLEHLVTDVMMDRYATSLKPSLKTQIDNYARQQQFLGKPTVIAGKTIDGDDFNSSQWKGKVVLVDFWATWCAPCRAELPHVLEIYNAYHMKGLEIVGISSDTSAKPVQDFLSQNNFPWTELFDPKTADTRMHPVCAQFQITGLPTMYLIDKQGILRSISGWKQMDEMIPKLLAEAEPTTQKAAP